MHILIHKHFQCECGPTRDFSVTADSSPPNCSMKRSSLSFPTRQIIRLSCCTSADWPLVHTGTPWLFRPSASSSNIHANNVRYGSSRRHISAEMAVGLVNQSLICYPTIQGFSVGIDFCRWRRSTLRRRFCSDGLQHGPLCRRRRCQRHTVWDPHMAHTPTAVELYRRLTIHIV